MKPVTAVRATTMTIGALTIPADTAGVADDQRTYNRNSGTDRLGSLVPASLKARTSK